ncbi:MAG TPA: hypothetical protein VIL97_09500 [Thermoanaerobaculia bacterium]
MTKPCSQFDTLMSDDDLQQLEAHAAECEGCREELGAWNEISSVAATLQETWESPALWPAIEAAIRSKSNVVAFWKRWDVWAVAAAIALMAGMGAVAWRVVSAKGATNVQEIVAIDDVESAEEAYRRSIDRLEEIAQPKLEEGATPLVVSYREKLMLLDDAIAECEANIETNRRNAYLRKQLLTLYQEKGQTLQELTRENPNVQ